MSTSLRAQRVPFALPEGRLVAAAALVLAMSASLGGQGPGRSGGGDGLSGGGCGGAGAVAGAGGLGLAALKGLGGTAAKVAGTGLVAREAATLATAGQSVKGALGATGKTLTAAEAAGRVSGEAAVLRAGATGESSAARAGLVAGSERAGVAGEASNGALRNTSALGEPAGVAAGAADDGVAPLGRAPVQAVGSQGTRKTGAALVQAGERALRRGVDLRRYPRVLQRHPGVAPHATDQRWLQDFAADHADFLLDLGSAVCDDDDDC